jgi:hypothetical protein
MSKLERRAEGEREDETAHISDLIGLSVSPGLINPGDWRSNSGLHDYRQK